MLTTNRYDGAMDEVSDTYGCNWDEYSKLSLMATFLEEQKADFSDWKKFLKDAAEYEVLAGSEPDGEEGE